MKKSPEWGIFHRRPKAETGNKCPKRNKTGQTGMKKARKPDLKQGKKALKKTEPNKSGPVVLVVNKLNLLERLPHPGEKSG